MNGNDLENLFEDLLRSFFIAIKSLFIGAFRGSKRLKEKSFLIASLITFIPPYILMSKYNWSVLKLIKGNNPTIDFIIFWIITLIIYLNFISGIGIDKKLGQKLIEAGIVCHNGQAPLLIGKSKNKKGYEVLTFKGTYKLEDWRRKISDIEVALNLRIIDIEQGKRKDVVLMKTVPPKNAMPEKIMWDDKYIQAKDGVINLGNNGVEDILLDLNKEPHIIVAGATGSGKSVVLKSIFWQMVNQGHTIIMADFKNGLEFGEDHKRFGEVITDKKRLLEVLTMLDKENELRQELLKKFKAKNLVSYNKKSKDNVKRVIVIIDEVAEVLDSQGVKGEEKELMDQISAKLSSFARVSRATGIHAILGVQRPDAKVITGQLKSNCRGRICGQVPDGVASEIVLDNRLAAKLPKIPGRMLFSNGGIDTIEFQSYFFDDDIHLKDLGKKATKLLIDDENFNKETFEFYKSVSEDIQEEIITENKPVREEKNEKRSLFKKKLENDINTSDEFESGIINWEKKENKLDSEMNEY